MIVLVKDRQPDDETTVLGWDGDEWWPCWVESTDAEVAERIGTPVVTWYWASGDRMDRPPSHWMHMPPGPPPPVSEQLAIRIEAKRALGDMCRARLKMGSAPWAECSLIAGHHGDHGDEALQCSWPRS
jgi:hypothetical protein